MTPDQTIQTQPVDIISFLITAITNFRLYPQGSAITTNAIDRMFNALGKVLEQKNSVVLAESEKAILAEGNPLSENSLKKPQVKALIELMVGLEIKSITFEKGLAKSEITDLLDILSKKPVELQKNGGIKDIISGRNMPHILLDQKIYVEFDKDRQIIAGIDIKDDDIIRLIMGDIPCSDADIQKIREMSQGSEWAARLFQAGVDSLIKRKEDIPEDKLTATCIHMIQVINDITDPEHKEIVSRSVADTISEMDDSLLANLLAKNIEDILGAGLFDHIINSLDEDKYKKLMALIKDMAGPGAEADGKPGKAEIESINKAYIMMLYSERTKNLEKILKEKEVLEKEQKEKHAAHIKNGISNIIKDKNGALADREVIQFLPGFIMQMFSKGKYDHAWILIDKLADGLSSDNLQVRIEVSQALSDIGETLISEKRHNELIRLSEKMVRWIENEIYLTPAYTKTCVQLQKLAQELIRKYEINECNRILEPFSLIYSGRIKRDKAIETLSGSVLNNIATDEILDILFREFQTNEKNNRKQVIESLSMLGEAPVMRLLDTLQSSEDRSERLRIIRIISGIGRIAAPSLISHIEKGGAWYYIRNLIAMLGKVGAEDHLKILQPFLGHKDFRVQFEALRSIHGIGGKQAGKILVSAMAESDDRLNSRIVSMLGSMNYREAISPLLDLLKSKSLVSSKARIDLEVNTCMALGQMNAEEAVPYLTEIVDQKSLLGIKSYNEKVKAAAGKALVMIKKST
ncbi:MAG TPA: HEAT repeat domain-containing protein [Desulfobacteraceae bacterium]|nr:HEAT repeat domain-containing protein [Desulfobacteraceae bacterium]